MSAADAANADGGRLRRGLATGAVAVATILAVVGLTMALFLNPAWVSFAQGRSDAATWTGWSPEQVDAVTLDIVLEVWLGPGNFAQEVAGEPVLNDRERFHMADVRRLVLALYAVVLLAVATLVVEGLASRGSRAFWRAVAVGAKVLAVGAVAIGAAFLLAFDTAFTLFHQLFFAASTWTFDPATERLVQLFPHGFWTETTVALAVVGLVITVGVWLMASRLARPPRAPAAPGTQAGAGAGGGDTS